MPVFHGAIAISGWKAFGELLDRLTEHGDRPDGAPDRRRASRQAPAVARRGLS
ncbi:hypothetical protein [Streptomyces sp. NRRL S-1448]|uniref:hypothetical protein n=1 Tax=Streptomyces sp. NRRL S-1448 TaxID=1463883 RepID=UPI00131E8CB3|nr:hypothetical protein [Streptomyces sp. NRRL S-1448]